LTKKEGKGGHNKIDYLFTEKMFDLVKNSFNLKTKRQKIIGTYRTDLYFPDYKLIIECDENDHKDRNQKEELERQNYLISNGYSILRYDPMIKILMSQ